MRRLLLVALLVSPAFVRAQLVSLYGTFSPLHASNVQSGTAYSSQNNPPPAPLTSSFWAEGVGAGVTLRMLPLGPVSLGLDLRGSTRPGTTGADTAMAGLKLTASPPLLRLKFYLQGSGGYLGTRTVNNTSYQQDPPGPNPQPYTNHYAAYEILGGIDRPILPMLDIRIVEIGAGKAYPISIGSSANTTNPNLLTVNTGLVFHF